jgi:hypothetical protein
VAEGHGLCKVGERAGVDRKTAHRYVEAAAQAAGLLGTGLLTAAQPFTAD